MSVNDVIGQPGTLRRNITVSLIVAVIIAFIFGFFRAFREDLRQIPGVAPVMDFLVPSLRTPEFSTGDVTVNAPDRSPFDLPPLPSINIERAGRGTACCNSCEGGRGDLVGNVEDYLSRIRDNSPPPPQLLPPIEPPCFPRTDWRAFINHPSNADLKRAYNNMNQRDWNWIAQHGYPMTMAGYAQYMVEQDPQFSRSVRNGSRLDPYRMTTC